MVWEFHTDPEFQKEIDWINQFVRDEIEPLDYVLGSAINLKQPHYEELVRPLQKQVKERGLWACHLGPELGGKGYGQVKLALMNEQFGRARFGPVVFGAQAPDTGNSEILAHYGTAEQKERYLQPLLDNQIVSCFSMTEPQGGADPTQFRTTAVEDGDEWVIKGDKWFSSNAKYASFYITMAVTDPEAPPHQRMSMFIVPAETPGIEIVHNLGFHGEKDPVHAYMRYNDVRVPRQNMLGGRGQAFVVAQTRLGGGRMHHAMRTVAQAQKCFDLMCERALSRTTKGEQLAKKQLIQAMIADAWIQLRQFRLLVLETAWLIDHHNDYLKVRKNISAVKAIMPKVLHDVASSALQVHGSLGISTDMPFTDLIVNSYHVGLADGPTEVHKITVARQVLRDYQAGDEIFPTAYRPTKREEAKARYGFLYNE
ncbi:MAG: acyl-CoA dehydrogenase family protein [Dehalococcoidia bacterium]|nr:acyl-CoA dehydrogenase family protein [Dehalococcoidia bacterium]